MKRDDSPPRLLHLGAVSAKLNPVLTRWVFFTRHFRDGHKIRLGSAGAKFIAGGDTVQNHLQMAT